ncbi:hypothetical protein [Salinispora arenicola]|uniref:Uncharacterized protein n=1 Tax=Salinispora arenicola TaxID=168697 RepID=A0A542XT91_SALAC|nr:hypothetical protein [Salinispora arenicola]MCN0151960.1 hypothetical protein [Salinispora arenicola]TQL39055.1 hypothetical protein FB564_4277 [Salinispora arenicola]GIM86874.1 hypothetical protein Sar04_36100 [Salinispora arenicola]
MSERAPAGAGGTDPRPPAGTGEVSQPEPQPQPYGDLLAGIPDELIDAPRGYDTDSAGGCG